MVTSDCRGDIWFTFTFQWFKVLMGDVQSTLDRSLAIKMKKVGLMTLPCGVPVTNIKFLNYSDCIWTWKVLSTKRLGPILASDHVFPSCAFCILAHLSIWDRAISRLSITAMVKWLLLGDFGIEFSRYDVVNRTPITSKTPLRRREKVLEVQEPC